MNEVEIGGRHLIMGLNGAGVKGALGQLDLGLGPAFIIFDFLARHSRFFLLFERQRRSAVASLYMGKKTRNARFAFLKITLTWIISAQQFPPEIPGKRAEWRLFLQLT